MYEGCRLLTIIGFIGEVIFSIGILLSPQLYILFKVYWFIGLSVYFILLVGSVCKLWLFPCPYVPFTLIMFVLVWPLAVIDVILSMLRMGGRNDKE